jgi:FkbM family methyltransferase
MGFREDAWRFARRVREWLRARGAWAPFEPFALWLAPRVLPPPAHETTANIGQGLRLVLPPRFPPAQSYQDRDYEPHLTQWFERTLQPGWVVVDGGANVGYYSVLASRAVGASGRVFAFEADPTNFGYLVRNLELNHCSNVHPICRALSDRAGTFSFQRHRYRAEGHLTEGEKPGPGTITVEACRLDDFLASQGVSSVHAMKLDIEGGEPAALRGAAQTIARSPELRVVVEYNRRALSRGGRNESEFFATLLRLGFTRARSLEVPGPLIRIERPVGLTGPSQNLELLR